jgi:hypothetical protein
VQYKERNYRPITKKAIGKILSIISKINRANDFVIVEGKNSNKVPDGLSLSEYISSQFGKYKSIQNWFFNYHFESYFKDANGILVVLPKYIFEEKEEIKPSDFLEPLPFFFNSDSLHYLDDDLIVIRKEKNEFIVLDINSVYEVKLNSKQDSYTTTILWQHNLGYIPFVQNGGTIKYYEDDFYFESFLAGVVPDFDHALVENTDKNTAIKMHVYPESAIFGQQVCIHCNGDGYKEKKVGNSIVKHSCSHCDGTGIAKSSTLADLVVRPAKGGEEALPSWAPKKYIDKDIKPVEFINNDVKDLIKSGYEAVNMAHLGEIPLAQSGVSKSYDWEQTNLFLFKIADYVCQVNFKSIIKYINDIRYGVLLGLNTTELNEQLPYITTPTNYDIIGVSEMENQISNAKQNGISSSILEEMELAYINKKFAGNPKQIAYHTNIILLDPLRGSTADDVLVMQNSGISQKTVITHNLINMFVTKAFEEVKNFQDLPLLKRFDIVDKYAEAYISDNKVKLIPNEPK